MPTNQDQLKVDNGWSVGSQRPSRHNLAVRWMSLVIRLVSVPATLRGFEGNNDGGNVVYG